MCWRAVVLVMLAFSQVARAQAPTEHEYVGCLTLGFEEAFFRPLADQGRVQWWIARVPENFSSWKDSVPAVSGYRMMFARVIARVGEPGRFGHLGMGSREIEIAEILELRQFQQSDGTCQEPPPPPPPPESFVDVAMTGAAAADAGQEVISASVLNRTHFVSPSWPESALGIEGWVAYAQPR